VLVEKINHCSVFLDAPLHDGDEIANRVCFGNDVHGDFDVEFVFDIHNEIENANGIDVEFGWNIGGSTEGNAVLVVRRQLSCLGLI
jgi:hypothetical protein